MSNPTDQKNFAAIGVAGYIAPRHLKAIRDTNNRLVAAVDPSDSVGRLDQFSYNVHFFSEIERFDRHLEKLRRGPEENKIHYVSIMTPNYLHDAHCRLALRVEADAICEKPLVINPWNLDQLEGIEQETGKNIYTVLQLRLHPDLIKLKQEIERAPKDHIHQVNLTYITSRGKWYFVSWKGNHEKSGGVALNIGIHFFDLLLWLFGDVKDIRVYYSDHKKMSGFLELERANVSWFLSVSPDDLPFESAPGGVNTFRSITVDGNEIEFSSGFTDLHTKVYEDILDGRGFRIKDARPSIDLTYKIRKTPISPLDEVSHPFLLK